MRDLSTRVEAFLEAMETSRGFVVSHARRVSTYAVRLATQYGLAPDVIENVRVGALLHDVGKLLIPTRILTKPGRLDNREWAKLRTHPDRGVDLLGRIGLNESMRDIVQHHHERYDGCGYPDGLHGQEIAWPVRIVSVMDSFDALTSARDYRDPISVEAARGVIAREAGTRFCPWVVAGFLSLPLSLLEPSPLVVAPANFLPDGRPESSAVHATQIWTAAASR